MVTATEILVIVQILQHCALEIGTDHEKAPSKRCDLKI